MSGVFFVNEIKFFPFSCQIQTIIIIIVLIIADLRMVEKSWRWLLFETFHRDEELLALMVRAPLITIWIQRTYVFNGFQSKISNGADSLQIISEMICSMLKRQKNISKCNVHHKFIQFVKHRPHVTNCRFRCTSMLNSICRE